MNRESLHREKTYLEGDFKEQITLGEGTCSEIELLSEVWPGAAIAGKLEHCQR